MPLPIWRPGGTRSGQLGEAGSRPPGERGPLSVRLCRGLSGSYPGAIQRVTRCLSSAYLGAIHRVFKPYSGFILIGPISHSVGPSVSYSETIGTMIIRV